jgi:hypothetical protein
MKIRPALEGVALDYEWSGESNRWARQYEVFLEDVNQPKQTWFRRSAKRRIGDKSWIIICSKEFLDQPNDEFSKMDLDKAVMQAEPNVDSLRDYLKDKISGVGDVSEVELFHRLEEFLILDPEDG